MTVHYEETKYGFQYGAARIERLWSCEKRKWIMLGVETEKMAVDIHVTKTGKIRVFDRGGPEWERGIKNDDKGCD